MKHHKDINQYFSDYCKKPTREKLMAILQQSQKLAYCICYRVLKDEHDAEDATQEVLIKIIKNINTLKKNPKLTSWINKVSLNQAIDFHRKKIKRSIIKTSTTKNSISTKDTTASHIDSMIIYEHIEQLKEDSKDLILNRFIKHLSIQEIASMTLKPHSTVRTQIEKALGQLRSTLTKSGFAALALTVIPTLGNAVAKELTVDITQRIPERTFNSSRISPHASITTFTKIMLIAPIIPLTVLILWSTNILTPVKKIKSRKSPSINTVYHQPTEVASAKPKPIKNKGIAPLSVDVTTNVKHKLPLLGINKHSTSTDDQKIVKSHYSGIIIDEITKQPINNVKIEIYQIFNYKKITIKSDKKGQYYAKSLTNNPFLFYLKFIKKGYATRITFQTFSTKNTLKVPLKRGVTKTYTILDKIKKPYVSGMLISYLPKYLNANMACLVKPHLTRSQWNNLKNIYQNFPSYLRFEQVAIINNTKGIVTFSNLNRPKAGGWQFILGKYCTEVAGRWLINPYLKHSTFFIHRPEVGTFSVINRHTGLSPNFNYLKIKKTGQINRKEKSLLLNSKGEVQINMLQFILIDRSDDGSSIAYGPSGMAPIESIERGTYQFEQEYNRTTRRGHIYLKDRSAIKGSIRNFSRNISPHAILSLNNSQFIASDENSLIPETVVDAGKYHMRVWNSDFTKLLFHNHIELYAGNSYHLEKPIKQSNIWSFSLKILKQSKPLINAEIVIENPNNSEEFQSITTDEHGIAFFYGFRSAEYKITCSIVADKDSDTIQEIMCTMKATSLMKGLVVLDFKHKVYLEATSSKGKSIESINLTMTKGTFSLYQNIIYWDESDTPRILTFFLPETGTYQVSGYDNNIMPKTIKVDQQNANKKITLKKKEFCTISLQFPKKLHDKSNIIETFDTTFYSASNGGSTTEPEIASERGSKINVTIKHPDFVTFKEILTAPLKSSCSIKVNLVESNCIQLTTLMNQHFIIIKELKINDILLKYNGTDIKNVTHFEKVFKNTKSEFIDIELIRDGQLIKTTIERININGITNHFIAR